MGKEVKQHSPLLHSGGSQNCEHKVQGSTAHEKGVKGYKIMPAQA